MGLLDKYVSTEDSSAVVDFTPKVGDLVEFDSDLQIDKGPCTGNVSVVDETTVTISFGSTDEATFKLDELQLKEYVQKEDRKVKKDRDLWILK